MRHFGGDDKSGGPHGSEEQWTDYARGLVLPELRRTMQAHLESGCELCRKRYELVRRLTEAGRSGAAEAPEEAVVRARALFRRPAAAHWMDRLQAWTAELLSSMPLETPLAGVRSLAAELQPGVGERLLYRAGDYIVDVKLDPAAPGSASEIIGQISNNDNDQETFDDVVVQLDIAGRTVAQVQANRHGEFLVARPARNGNAVLRLGLPRAGRKIEIALRPPSK